MTQLSPGRLATNRPPALPAEASPSAFREHHENEHCLTIQSQAIQITGFPSYPLLPQQFGIDDTQPHQRCETPAFSGLMVPVI
jgi:hypothetical protein